MAAAMLLTLCSFESGKKKHILPIAKKCTDFPALATFKTKAPVIEVTAPSQTTATILTGNMTPEETRAIQQLLAKYGSLKNAQEVVDHHSK